MRHLYVAVMNDCGKTLVRPANRLYHPHLYIEGTNWTEWTAIRRVLATVLKFLERITSSWRAQSGGPYAIVMCTYL
jgi:hypothetical protein